MDVVWRRTSRIPFLNSEPCHFKTKQTMLARILRTCAIPPLSVTHSTPRFCATTTSTPTSTMSSKTRIAILTKEVRTLRREGIQKARGEREAELRGRRELRLARIAVRKEKQQRNQERLQRTREHARERREKRETRVKEQRKMRRELRLRKKMIKKPWHKQGRLCTKPSLLYASEKMKTYERPSCEGPLVAVHRFLREYQTLSAEQKVPYEHRAAGNRETRSGGESETSGSADETLSRSL